MAKMITQLDLLSKHVMGGGLQFVNVVESTLGSAWMIPSLLHYTMRKFNTWEIKWGVLTPFINENVGIMVGRKIKWWLERLAWWKLER
ncbi:hypothetical protein MTR67_002705 [Solanum verrucosum]|uniref:Uncharacterized protein n=1 Tax=Solanum verrucosum TaxID=315347 RepID=A0AAF0PSY4_SOLVR|nr:hypothetical protein MTR67_002702 [Solanum verrucosum]WMV09320.1 hypothetical protein MTR67_002705 [Solanum verrucosum]